ncbi:hypothetical protein BCR33DRAFT_721915 [Rhizoclosmatium globosum]|uniref:Amino acid transporter transmembrane domain-containing protein n=1 Tax=Rhizoclosmatium globosum TaxID=329046 RepID=A0A1Y2BPL9_9FUNG|nr:hypothetical protein BCR33DRAFT_721915 [Rhizoclosmatium globosum]|eukprot:ORY36698.1 hypothetical protein BCR33DRAFT_721915 [Rhizoclosmatium globosum]
MTGIGMIQTSLVFQQSGWLPVTLFFALFMVISSLCALFMVEAMQAIPGNRYFQGHVEFGTLINFYFGSTAHMIGQFSLYGALEVIAVGSIIQSSQTMDNLLIDIFGRTCGVSMGITSGSNATALSWFCVDSHGDSISPFGNEYMILTQGLLIVAIVIIPQCIVPLSEVLWIQVICFGVTLCVFLEWIVASCVNGLHMEYVPVMHGQVSGYAGLVGTVMLNYAFVQTVPSWVNVRRPDVNIQQSIWISSFAGFVCYILTGLLPALAYLIPEGSNLIAVLTTNGGMVNKVFGYLFSLMVLMMSVPVLLIVAKLNLDQNFEMQSGVSTFLAQVVPWILCIPFLTGTYLTEINNWGSLVFVSVANFVVPLLIYLRAVEFRKS